MTLEELWELAAREDDEARSVWTTTRNRVDIPADHCERMWGTDRSKWPTAANNYNLEKAEDGDHWFLNYVPGCCK
jgi:hypothetical protein